MSAIDPANVIHTAIWKEEPEPENPFAVKTAFCHGYDVYGSMLGRARWVEMLFLLFRGEKPSSEASELFEHLAVALANPGPRDASVHAAMCGGACGSTSASSLMAALASGAGRYLGARDVFDAVKLWQAAGCQLASWSSLKCANTGIDVWPEREGISGCEEYGHQTSTVVIQALAVLSACSPGKALPWLKENRLALEQIWGKPLALTGVAAAAFFDLGFSADEAEMLTLLLRLPGAAAHALEQRNYGFKNFPFYPVELEND